MSITPDHPNETLIPDSGVLGIIGVLNLSIGYRIAGAAASGNYLRGNGTNFVSSAIQAGDLTGLVVSSITGTANQIIASASTGAVTLSLGGPHNYTTLTAHSLVLGQGTSAQTALGAATNGQLPIGSTGADPVLATLTGTANQISVANAAGAITLSTPQDIGTASAVTFGSVTAATVQGSTSASGTITVKSTSNATKGDMILDAADITMTSTMRARMSGQNRFRHLNNLCKATNSTDTTISTSTITIVNWDSEDYDTDSIHSTSSNTSRFTVAIAGKYLLECNLRYATPAASTGSVHVGWRLNGNGASDKNVAAIPISNSANLLMVNAALPVSLAANDYVEFWAFQSNGGNMTLTATDSFGAITYMGE